MTAVPFDAPLTGRALAALDRRWLAFWLSLLLPGAGQIYLRHWSAAVWIACALTCGVLVAQFHTVPYVRLLAFFFSVALSLASAEHAKRLYESNRWPRDLRRDWHRTPTASVRWHRPRGRSIGTTVELILPVSVERLWRRVSDLENFLTLDPFHLGVTIPHGRPRVGMPMVLHHQIFGVRLDRQSRLLRWNLGRGYTFSDLSSHCPGEWFPHVFHIDVEPCDAPLDASGSCTSRLTVRVLGKWTNRWIPVWLSRFWVLYVMREHARLLRNYL